MHWCPDETAAAVTALSSAGFIATWVRMKWHSIRHFLKLR